MPFSKIFPYPYLYQHLPNVPSAKEVMEKGISLSDMSARLLKQIEEQALYIIELNKRLEKLEEKQR
ncbi:MAG: hypothetical protein HND27_01235 [Bacteroidetes bacterium]|nr:hypothetical protein [Flavobacteriales bacterium]NOG94381.1 hypothetical protein [Bacteroidota bacterium]WKZ75256.1 MAG: hypothetical protein QY303_14035 [Vicingaceae bacterium]